MERLKRAREEKQRKDKMLKRGIPAPKPLTAQQKAEQEAARQMVLEKKGMQRSQIATHRILRGPEAEITPYEQDETLGGLSSDRTMPMLPEKYTMQDNSNEDPISIQFQQQVKASEMEDFKEQERISYQKSEDNDQ
jgi:hypothetical protein